mmetsp:Transcript_26254/g.44700  ORF Transcript_26254/g.44700 Transcript_26254/m.44700 type:complete len:242 (-) Transcript_26254:300-1025(-)
MMSYSRRSSSSLFRMGTFRAVPANGCRLCSWSIIVTSYKSSGAGLWVSGRSYRSSVPSATRGLEACSSSSASAVGSRALASKGSGYWSSPSSSVQALTCSTRPARIGSLSVIATTYSSVSSGLSSGLSAPSASGVASASLAAVFSGSSSKVAVWGPSPARPATRQPCTASGLRSGTCGAVLLSTVAEALSLTLLWRSPLPSGASRLSCLPSWHASRLPHLRLRLPPRPLLRGLPGTISWQP